MRTTTTTYTQDIRSYTYTQVYDSLSECICDVVAFSTVHIWELHEFREVTVGSSTCAGILRSVIIRWMNILDAVGAITTRNHHRLRHNGEEQNTRNFSPRTKSSFISDQGAEADQEASQRRKRRSQRKEEDLEKSEHLFHWRFRGKKQEADQEVH